MPRLPAASLGRYWEDEWKPYVASGCQVRQENWGGCWRRGRRPAGFRKEGNVAEGPSDNASPPPPPSQPLCISSLLPPGAGQLPTSPLRDELLGVGDLSAVFWRSLRRDNEAYQPRQLILRSKFRGSPLLTQTPAIRTGTQQVSALQLRKRGLRGVPK